MVDGLVQGTSLPFIDRVMQCPPLTKFKVLQIDANDDTKDLADHLETYKARMDLQAIPDELMCRAFSITLKGSTCKWFDTLRFGTMGPTRKWFDTLRSGTIDSFNELSKQFLGQFTGGRTHWKSCVYFLTIKQREMKMLREYILGLTEKNWWWRHRKRTWYSQLFWGEYGQTAHSCTLLP